MRRTRWEAQERSEEVIGQIVGKIYECQPGRFMGRLRTGSCWWTMGKLGCGEEDVVLSKDVVVESEAKVRPTLPISIVISSQAPYACKTTSNFIDLPRILFPLPSLHCQTHELGRPRFIAVWYMSDTFPFKLAVTDPNMFDRREGRSIFKRAWSSRGS